MEDKKKKYRVVGTDLLYNNITYPEGETIELMDKEVEPLVNILQQLVEDKEPEGPGKDEIIALINSAELIEAVEALVKDETDDEVLEAASARIDEINAAEQQQLSRPSANEMVKLINEAETVEAVNELVAGDSRIKVTQTAERKIKTLKKEGGNN